MTVLVRLQSVSTVSLTIYAGKATLTLINLEQGHEKEYSLALDGVKSGEVQLIVTALDFGAKREDVVIKPRSDHGHLTLPLPVLGGVAQGGGPRSPKSPKEGPSPRLPQPPSLSAVRHSGPSRATRSFQPFHSCNHPLRTRHK